MGVGLDDQPHHHPLPQAREREAMKIIPSFLRRLLGLDWIVVETGWPFPKGYGTYHPRKNAVLDTGLFSREEAQRLCDELNARPSKGVPDAK